MAALPSSRITEKGQVTIPAEMRHAFDLKPRDRVEFEVVDGRITLKRARSRIRDFYGIVTPVSRPEDFRALRESFEQGVADEVMESMRREEADLK